ncbi:MAG: hypothetical protein KGY80_12995 [Candidatus Thorarchaeota archaeon]|nr:hypothetical protein [Candidatus Thorarchaeota archaeon]
MIARTYTVQQEDSTSSEKHIYPDSSSSGNEIEEIPLEIPEEEGPYNVGSELQELERNLHMLLSTSRTPSGLEESEDDLPLNDGSSIANYFYTLVSLYRSTSERLRTVYLARRIQILVPDIPPQLIEELSRNKETNECFSRILYNLKRKLIGIPEVIDYDVERLEDPEGIDLKVYFVVETTEISRNRRLQIRRLMSEEIDRTIMKHIEEKQLVEDMYFELRPVFGAFVEV